MKFVVGKHETKQEEIKVFFWLEQNENSVVLRAKREDDNDEYDWSILLIDSEGLHLSEAVGADLGFPLDTQEHILLKE